MTTCSTLGWEMRWTESSLLQKPFIQVQGNAIYPGIYQNFNIKLHITNFKVAQSTRSLYSTCILIALMFRGKNIICVMGFVKSLFTALCHFAPREILLDHGYHLMVWWIFKLSTVSVEIINQWLSCRGHIQIVRNLQQFI